MQFRAAPDDVRWALNVALGGALAYWGFATLDPHTGWFTNLIGLALLISGAMQIANRALVAATIMVPVSFHLLLTWLLFRR